MKNASQPTVNGSHSNEEPREITFSNSSCMRSLSLSAISSCGSEKCGILCKICGGSLPSCVKEKVFLVDSLPNLASGGNKVDSVFPCTCPSEDYWCSEPSQHSACSPSCNCYKSIGRNDNVAMWYHRLHSFAADQHLVHRDDDVEPGNDMELYLQQNIGALNDGQGDFALNENAVVNDVDLGFDEIAADVQMAIAIKLEDQESDVADFIDEDISQVNGYISLPSSSTSSSLANLENFQQENPSADCFSNQTEYREGAISAMGNLSLEDNLLDDGNRIIDDVDLLTRHKWPTSIQEDESSIIQAGNCSRMENHKRDKSPNDLQLDIHINGRDVKPASNGSSDENLSHFAISNNKLNNNQNGLLSGARKKDTFVSLCQKHGSMERLWDVCHRCDSRCEGANLTSSNDFIRKSKSSSPEMHLQQADHKDVEIGEDDMTKDDCYRTSGSLVYLNQKSKTYPLGFHESPAGVLSAANRGTTWPGRQSLGRYRDVESLQDHWTSSAGPARTTVENYFHVSSLSATYQSPPVTTKKIEKNDEETAHRPITMIWSPEEAKTKLVSQIGVSACGPTAVLNVLIALNVAVDVETVCQTIHTNLRDEEGDMVDYLLSRSHAGTTAEQLLRGVQSLSQGSVIGRFFPTYGKRDDVQLSDWLSKWMSLGAVPLLSLNLQRGSQNASILANAWHHQMMYGTSQTDVYLSNPFQVVPIAVLEEQLNCPSEMKVRVNDLLQREMEGMDLGRFTQQTDPRWNQFNVLGQVVNCLREHGIRGQHNLPYTFVNIPAAYDAGITLYVRVDGRAADALKMEPELSDFL